MNTIIRCFVTATVLVLAAACGAQEPTTSSTLDSIPSATPGPLPSPSPSPSPPPSPSPSPSPSGPPNRENTGPRTDELEPSNGVLVISQPGALVEKLDHRGEIYVEAPRVVLRDIRVRSNGWYGIRVFEGASDVLIERAEVSLEQEPEGQAAIASVGGGLTVRDSELRGNGDGVKIGNGDTFERNWIHMTKPKSGSDLHLDGLQADGGGSDVVIRENRIELPPDVDGNAAIIINGALAPSDGDILIEDNWLDGGNYTIYAGLNKDGSCQPDVRVVGNRFGRSQRYGLLSSGDCDVAWRGNTFMDTGDRAPLS